MRILAEFLNKKFSTPTGTIFILLFTLWVGGFLIWQCQIMPKYGISLIKPFPRPQKEVVITTDKIEYELGELVTTIISNNSDGERWALFPYYTIEKRDNGNWVEIRRVAAPCGSLMPAYNLKLDPGETKEYEWGQRETWCTGEPLLRQELVSQQVPAGAYRMKSRVVSDLELGDPATIYSNEFRIKESFSQQIFNKCEEERRLAEEVYSDPDCLEGKESRCVDGWSVLWHYDKRLVSATEFPQTFPSDAPKELKEATVAEHGRSVCNCEKPISYRILKEEDLEETTCEEFYKFIEDYNSSCNDCLLEWSFECC